MELAVPLPPCRAGTLRDIGLPADRKVQNTKCDGRGVVIGIIDDGCAFANWNFINGHRKSRLRYLWDQSNAAKDTTKGWQSLSGQTSNTGPGPYGYGLPNLPT